MFACIHANCFALLALMLCAAPLFAAGGACDPAYTGDQCLQMVDDADEEDEEPGGPAPSGCPYYMCGNASPAAMPAEGWCEAKQTWINCMIAYCQYSPCTGLNCYVMSMTCSGCPSLPGNNAYATSCPRI